ncbi:MAG: hypothetical protein JW712_11995 [Dehalococcoidales bacterium]|nr:hypothetical protein [Dehalococcoidales bacterium]
MAESECRAVCPVCDKPNPAGTRFCEYCRSAAINQDGPLISKELEDLMDRFAEQEKLNRNLAFGTDGAFGSAISGIVLHNLSCFTTTVFQPSDVMNSELPPCQLSMFRGNPNHIGSIGTEFLEAM